MKVLVLNCGSSSVKFQMIETKGEKVLAKGLVEKIGSSVAGFKYKSHRGEELYETRKIHSHQRAIEIILDALVHKRYGALKKIDEIEAVGHRVVHAGEHYSGSVMITREVIDALTECIRFAPLHNPANLHGIEVTRRLLPDVPEVGVFDTAFHQGMPAEAYIYPLPYELYEKLRVRRYGFHGTSHRFVSHKAAEILGKPLSELKLITCHLGNGSSIAAVRNGVSVDTSMGFTPLEGLVMGTRCGDIDPAILPYLMMSENLSPQEVDNLMNKRSGLQGVSGVSNDVREILEEMEEGNERARLAFDIFCRRVKKYIAGYAAVMDGVDAVIFTAGIGENSPEVREAVLSGLDFMGIKLDKKANLAAETNVSKGKVAALIVPTNEELAIARDTAEVIKGASEKLVAEAKQVAPSLLAEPEKAALVMLFNDHSSADLDDLAKMLSERIGRPVVEDVVSEHLAAMGLK